MVTSNSRDAYKKGEAMRIIDHWREMFSLVHLSGILSRVTTPVRIVARKEKSRKINVGDCSGMETKKVRTMLMGALRKRWFITLKQRTKSCPIYEPLSSTTGGRDCPPIRRPPSSVAEESRRRWAS